jgi:hypothetical protein
VDIRYNEENNNYTTYRKYYLSGFQDMAMDETNAKHSTGLK